MDYREGQGHLRQLRSKISDLRDQMRTLQTQIEPQVVFDHTFATTAGTCTLREFFEDASDLIVIHNMGRRCAYCTLWADGYNGVFPQLRRRAAFIVVSPDPPAAQLEFARTRGWRFPMASDTDRLFAKAMGYTDERGRCVPGISCFRLVDEQILRVAEAASCPRDDFCSVWHLFDMLPEGAAEWQPTLAPPGP